MYSALILAGGFGTRLSQTVPNLPKVLAPIQGIPFLKLLIEQLEQSKLFSNIVLGLGYRSSNVIEFLKNNSFSIPIHLSIETKPLGTGGAIVQALNQIKGDCFLVMNGDSFCNLSLPSFLTFHQEKQALFSIACSKVDNASRYGSLKWDETRRITHFLEKTEECKPGWISAGIYWTEKKLFKDLPHVSYSIEKDLLPLFLKSPIFAYPHEGTFIDIGTHESYYKAQKTLKPWIKNE